MTPAAGAALAAAATALLAALLDLRLPAPSPPRVARRLLRAAPAGLLAVGLRLADAPPLTAVALMAWAVADALALDGEPGVGGWTVARLGEMLSAAAVWELAPPALLAREPWRAAGALLVLVVGWRWLARGGGVRGELRALAPLPVGLLAAAAAGAGAQSFAMLLIGFTAAVACRAATEMWSGPWRLAGPSGPGGRALRSAAAFALAAPLLPWPR